MAEAASDLDTWKAEAKSLQGQLALCLGNRIWDAYKLPEETSYLWLKIATALYGHPNITENSAEEKKVNLIRDKCIKYSKEEPDCVHMAIIFTFVYRKGEIQGTVPVFRVRRQIEADSGVSKSYFIDHMGTHFKSWKHYLNKNIWKMCWLCVPKGGFYKYCDPEYVEFLDQSKRGSFVNAVGKGCEAAESVADKAMGVGMLLTFIPPAAPVGLVIDIAATALKSLSWIYKGIKWVGGGKDKSNFKPIAYKDEETSKEKREDAVDGNLSRDYLTDAEIQEFKIQVFFLMHTVIEFEVSSADVQDFLHIFRSYLNIFGRLQGKRSTDSLSIKIEKHGNAETAKKIITIESLEELIEDLKYENENYNEPQTTKKFIHGPQEVTENPRDLSVSEKSVMHPQELTKDTKTLYNSEDFFQHFPEHLYEMSKEPVSEHLQASATKVEIKRNHPRDVEKLSNRFMDFLPRQLTNRWLMLLIPPAILLVARLRRS